MSEAFVDGASSARRSSRSPSSARFAPRSSPATFAVGEKLPTETRMSEIFGVSRTVVREAVAILSADGLVEPRPARASSCG